MHIYIYIPRATSETAQQTHWVAVFSLYSLSADFSSLLAFFSRDLYALSLSDLKTNSEMETLVPWKSDGLRSTASGWNSDFLESFKDGFKFVNR